MFNVAFQHEGRTPGDFTDTQYCKKHSPVPLINNVKKNSDISVKLIHHLKGNRFVDWK